MRADREPIPVRGERGAGGSVASSGRGRHGTLRSRRGGTGRGLTSRGRSSARGACSRRSLLGWGRRVGQSMERGRWNEKDAMDGRVRRGGIMRGMRRWTNLAWDRSAPRPRGASRPSAPSNPPRISDRTDGFCARSARVESSPACRPPVTCRRDAASEEDPPSIHRALNDETRGRWRYRGKQQAHQVVVS